MAPTFDLKTGQYLVWTFEKPYPNTTCASPSFLFQGSEWYFALGTTSSNYYIFMKNDNQKKVYGSCHITIYIENGNEEINDSVYCSFRTVGYGSSIVFWLEFDDIKEKIPNFCSIKILRLTFNVHGSINHKLYLTSERGDKSNEVSPHSQTDPCFDSLSDDFRNLLHESSQCDIELKCGDYSTRAHKIILCARSKVFVAMLQNDMTESRTGVVNIRDMDADIFQDFLRYVYTGTLPELTVEKAKHLYEAGDKYEVFGLKRRCSNFLKENFTKQNVLELLISADAHSDKQLKERAIAYILDEKIPLDEQWSAFCDSHPKLAIEVLTIAYLLHMN